MSLEHLKELKLPYYFYSCGNDTTIASMRVYAECQNASLKDALERHLYVEHTIIDERVVKAMRNKANCIKRFYLKNAWTFGILFTIGVLLTVNVDELIYLVQGVMKKLFFKKNFWIS